MSEIKEGEAGYDEYVAQSAAALGKNPENLAFARPFDITLKNPQTGEEYQPNEAVQVSIQLLKDSLNNYANVDAVHISDGTGETAQVMDTTVHVEAVEFAADGFSVYVLIASNSTGSGAEADSGYTCALTIGESASLSAILSGLSIEADGVKSVAAEGNNLTVNQTAGEQPTDWTVVLNSAEGDVLRLTMSDDSTVGIAVKPLVTVTANDAGKTYGDSDPGTFTAAVTGLAGEDTVAYSVSRETGENAGTYAITPSGEEIQGNYVVEYKTGTFTVEQKPLTITADSDTKAFDGAPLTKATFTYSGLVAGDTIVSMTMSESSAQIHMGTCENVPEAAVIRNASNEDVTANYAITFTTGDKGTVTVALDQERDGLSIQKNTVYFLEMTAAPYDVLDGVYYQKDDTFYSFLITDEPSYEYGDIFSYFNGDVLKVRCYPEAEGINVTKRFGGNYTLTDEQKNAIRFVLQKEAQYTASGWVDVESHTYADFAYGSINFDTGRKGGTELEDFATYRIIEEHALPEALADTIDENVSVTVSYQQSGKRVTENSNEFTVDPDEKLAFSYDFAFTNEYVDHKLTLIKIDENTGAPLPGAIFSVYAADNTETPVATCTTEADGSITIHRSDEGAGYAFDTLYYVVESAAPDGHILPANPERTYFYFS